MVSCHSLTHKHFNIFQQLKKYPNNKNIKNKLGKINYEKIKRNIDNLTEPINILKRLEKKLNDKTKDSKYKE